MFKSIRWRLTLTYLALTLFTLLLLGGTSIWFFERNYLKDLENQLLAEGKLVAAVAKPYFTGNEPIAELDGQVKNLGRESATRITIMDREGRVLGDSHESIKVMENHFNRPEIREAIEDETGTTTRYSTTLKTRMMYVAQPIYLGNNVVGYVRMALSLTKIQDTLGRLEKLFAGILLVVTLLSVLLSLKFARGITRPIEDITNAARKITQGEYDHVIYPDTADEIGQLAKTINLMAATIKDKIDEIARGKGELEAVLAHMVSGVIVFDKEGRIMLVNPAAEEALNLEGKKVLGHHGLKALRNFQFDESFQEIIEKGAVIVREITFIFPQEKTFQVHLAPVWGQGGQFLGVVSVFHDITAIRELEEMRTDFVANASHELQTPLTAVKGFAETLLDGAKDNPETCEKFISIINKEAERMSRLVDDLLDLAKIEGQKIIFNFQPVELKNFVTDTIQRILPLAEKNQLSISTIIPEDLPAVKGDIDWLAQVLLNLLDNSIKYTPAGGEILIRAFSKENMVRVEVKDTGIGIPPKDLSRVFERFYRVDKARSRSMGGTGLGLAIVKHIVENHGGTVSVESREGKGSIFGFSLPIQEV